MKSWRPTPPKYTISRLQFTLAERTRNSKSRHARDSQLFAAALTTAGPAPTCWCCAPPDHGGELPGTDYGNMGASCCCADPICGSALASLVSTDLSTVALPPVMGWRRLSHPRHERTSDAWPTTRRWPIRSLHFAYMEDGSGPAIGDQATAPRQFHQGSAQGLLGCG